MKPLEKEVRHSLIKSFRQAVNDKKEIRTDLIKEIKAKTKDKQELTKLRPVSANAHLLALILRDLRYKRMLKSYQSPKSFWKQISSLHKAKFEFHQAQVLLSVQRQFDNTGAQDIASIESTEFYSLVKLFNNEQYDPKVAEMLATQVERAFANCQSEMVSGGHARDGVDDRGLI